MNQNTEIRFAPNQLEAWSVALLRAAGVREADATEVAQHLIFADMRGVDTHGTSRLTIYVQRIEQGSIACDNTPHIVHETPVSALIDGDNGLGQAVATYATDLAIAKAATAGMAAVAVRHSNHCGCMAYYTLRMARAGLIGIGATNSPASMPPFGARDALFGTNPLSVAVPAGHDEPFVLDMATSQVARGKILNAAREGRSIPEGWALDRDGRPTTDSAAALAGYVVPLGGAKGSGLAFVVEILAGVLPGALLSTQMPSMYGDPATPARLGQFFLALRPDLFMPRDEFEARVEQVMTDLRGLQPAPDYQQVLAPGDVERAKESEYRLRGIPIQPGVLREFNDMASRYHVPLPEPLAPNEDV